MYKLLNDIFYGKYREISRYIIVGGCTTLVNLITFTVMRGLFNINVNISNVVSIIISILFAYVTNKVFVFESHCLTIKELLSELSKFFGARLLTMIIEVGGVFLLYDIIGQNEFVAKIEIQVIVLIANYIISKFFVFSK